jgi:hypothetical protein
MLRGQSVLGGGLGRDSSKSEYSNNYRPLLAPLHTIGEVFPAGTFPLLGLLIAWYHNTSTAAWVYLAMHGSYGLIWIVKDLTFPDPNWQKRTTIGAGLYVFFGVLVWYWVFG